jgi:predicted deacylase
VPFGLAAVAAIGCARATRGARGPEPPAGGSGAPGRPTVRPESCCAEIGYRIADGHRVAALAARRFTHAQLWAALDPFVGAGAPDPPAIRVRQIARSVEGRAIRAVTFGRGRTTVLLWSQMHGNESTATMALADLIAWLADPASRGDPLHARLADALTVVMVPMLNPDGAQRFRRENAMGVDVNRDADRLATPEARALKALRDSIRPAFGFNLHDQRPRAAGARSGPTAAIALLAPATGPDGAFGPTRAAARLVAAELAVALQRELPGRVTKYDETYNPRAFGDLMQRSGTSTVLIETGALPGDPEKQRLRAVNVVALVTALDAIATERFRGADPRAYDALPANGRSTSELR